ncbi:transcriptional regulator [Pseudomonas aeruginosa]
MKDRSHDTAMAEHFRFDPTYAAELFAEVRRDGTPAELAISICPEPIIGFFINGQSTANWEEARRLCADAYGLSDL